MSSLLPQVLENLSKRINDKEEVVFQAWNQIVGDKIGSMATPKQFKDNILFVSVKNSSLYSILKTQQKDLLLKKLKQKVPSVKIQNIVFHIGV